MSVVVVGDVLLDVDVVGSAERLCPDAPVPVVSDVDRRVRPGGAGLAALLAARAGEDVVLLTGLARDPAGAELRRLLADRVELVELPFRGSTVRKTRVRAAGQSLVRIDEGDGSVPDEPIGGSALAALRSADAVLVADYGNGTTDNGSLRSALSGLPAEVPLVWDPHPKGARPLARADLAVPNRSEAAPASPEPAEAAAALRRNWGCAAVAVTTGAEGAVLVPPEPAERFTPATAVSGDVCGAGDRFAVAALSALLHRKTVADAVSCAVDSASRFIADGGAAELSQRTAEQRSGSTDALELAARVRAGGGRVVATGGCFDLLHPGHVRLLERARELGDALVVCLNSDDSVRRRKGPHRPVLTAADRARMLAALEPVDAVAVFDEDTPAGLLAELRPDVWVKGEDYDRRDLPEAEVVRRFGGRTVLVPLVDGHSTTRLLATGS